MATGSAGDAGLTPQTPGSTLWRRPPTRAAEMDFPNNPHRMLADASTHVFVRWYYKRDGSGHERAALAGPGDWSPATRVPPPAFRESERIAGRRERTDAPEMVSSYHQVLFRMYVSSAAGEREWSERGDAGREWAWGGVARPLPAPVWRLDHTAAQHHCRPPASSPPVHTF